MPSFADVCARAQKAPNKGDNVEKVTKSIRIDPKLWRRARVRAVGEGRTIQDLVADSLRKYLAEKKAGRKEGKLA